MSIKNENDTMIFNALYLNDHNKIWDVGHTVGKLYNYSLSNDVNKKVTFFNVFNCHEYWYGFLMHLSDLDAHTSSES